MSGTFDLAAKRLGAMVVAASDEFFAPKERLLEPSPPLFEPGRYTDHGKWMDGWETRRRRGPGHDWAVVRLGVPGIVRRLVVDTTHFRGNQPAACSLDGLADEAGTGAPEGDWFELLPLRDLEADQEHTFELAAGPRVTHVRLNIHPDGGVARLRVLGEALPDLRALARPSGRLDLAAMVNGGQVVACSDMSFGTVSNLVAPGDAVDMGDGWETRRRRGPGHDWAVVRLAAEATIERIEVDTTHYKGNYPDRCAVEAARAEGPGEPEGGWWTVVPSSPLGPHARHGFEAAEGPPATHVRLDIHPDGGVSRLRVWGRVTDAGWERWGLKWLNALPAAQAEDELLACCGSREWARRVAAARPFTDAEALRTKTDAVWRALGRDDRLEAFAAHPRIGEPAGPGAWSRREQAGVAGAEERVLADLEQGNRAYEKRFGHVFLVCASGRGAADLLAELRRRLDDDPATEFEVAAEEQRKITRLRLERLFRL